MKILTLDTSCVMNLMRFEEAPDEALLRLLRFGLEGRVSIAVTHVAAAEVPLTHDSSSYVRERLAAFPERQVSGGRAKEHEDLAAHIVHALWPNAVPSSAKSEHNLRDSRHLSAHKLSGGTVFVTRDEELRKKVQRHPELGLVAESPTEVVHDLDQELGAAHRPWRTDIAVRPARDDDAEAIKGLLAPVANLYPDFESWLGKTLRDAQTRVALGVVEGQLAGISVWKAKDRRVAKLATFFVAQDYRQEGLGPHLLFHQMREWVDARVQKVVVTVASRMASILPFFFQYGFRVEGVSGRRYKAGEPEIVLGKHFFYERVEASNLEAFIASTLDIWALPNQAAVRDVANWFIQPRAEQALAVRSVDDVIELRDTDGLLLRRFGVGHLEELLYPARLGVDTRRAFMIPIQPQWAARMMQKYESSPSQIPLFNDPIDKLLLRTDNAYYCHPRYTPAILRDSPVLFYVSGQVGAVAGVARILECHVAPPDDLFLRFGDIGAYGLRDIATHMKKRGHEKGHAMALRFGWWVPLPNAVKLPELRKLGLAHPQSITAMSYANYEKVLAAGGLEW
jgi:N-acetylglutamate synthase-like GNAT family acetyltransferase